jgi:hypothetical protein
VGKFVRWKNTGVALINTVVSAPACSKVGAWFEYRGVLPYFAKLQQNSSMPGYVTPIPKITILEKVVLSRCFVKL